MRRFPLRLAAPAAALVHAVLVAGCATPETALPPIDVPREWSSRADATATLADTPWVREAAPELGALIREALANNSDLRIAAERVELSRAQFGLSRSALFPEVGVSLSDDRQRVPGFGGAGDAVVGSATLGLAVPTWEIDLWGRLRSATESARRQLLATEDTRRAIYTGLVAEVSTTYIALLEADAQAALSRQTAAARRESLRLVDLRYRGGVASRLEVNDATTLVAGAERAIASSERTRAQTENQLAVLVGRNPGPIRRERRLADYDLPQVLPAGLPSAVLGRRYDIRSTEESLRAADANVDAARKAFFPAITLTGLLGFAHPSLRELFDSGRYAWSASAAATFPLFNAGRLSSNLEAAQASQRIAVEQYKAAVRTAFREVEDALVAYRRLTEERVALAKSVAANRERLRLSELRYRGGVAAYFEVLDASRQLFDAESQLLSIQSAQYKSVISFYRAVGGGWDDEAAVRDLPPSPYAPRRPGAVW
jgi:multidrug efflux system outer membrane protein